MHCYSKYDDRIQNLGIIILFCSLIIVVASVLLILLPECISSPLTFIITLATVFSFWARLYGTLYFVHNFSANLKLI